MPERHQVQPPLITIVSSAGELEEVRSLWREYWDSLSLPDDFQGFAAELNSLPGAYALPGGMLLLARVLGEPAGTAGLRSLDRKSCEAKRLYVRPSYRGAGIAKALLDRLITGAQAQGYSEMYCDTLSTMTAALELYKQTGFREVGPYSSNRTPGAIFLRLSL